MGKKTRRLKSPPRRVAGRVRLLQVRGRALDHRVDVRVDPLGLANVADHDLAVAQGRLPETQLEELEGADVPVRLVAGRHQLLGQKVPVLAHKELLGPVDVDQHRDNVRGPPRLAR